jgi:ribonucleoside-diphosphate reductase beta chain
MSVMKSGLFVPSVGFRPFRYPWAEQYWLKQQQVHWIPEEVPLSEDVRDWSHKLSPQEKNLLTHIFRFFTQSDIEVSDNYMERYSQIFKPTEVKMMLAAFANMETIHISAYALLVDTVGMPEAEYQAFLDYEAMKNKHDFLQNFKVDSTEDILRNLAVFGGFTEGLQLFASFAMLLNFPRFGKMKGMGQIVTWSVRDESLHCEGIIRLFRTLAQETGALTPALKQELRETCEQVVKLEDAFIDLAFELGGVEGLEPEDVKQYIRYVADWRLKQLGLQSVWNIKDHPLPWLKSILNGVEHANFFETRATEYSKAATSGSWQDSWNHFDEFCN